MPFLFGLEFKVESSIKVFHDNMVFVPPDETIPTFEGPLPFLVYYQTILAMSSKQKYRSIFCSLLKVTHLDVNEEPLLIVSTLNLKDIKPHTMVFIHWKRFETTSGANSKFLVFRSFRWHSICHGTPLSNVLLRVNPVVNKVKFLANHYSEMFFWSMFRLKVWTELLSTIIWSFITTIWSLFNNNFIFVFCNFFLFLSGNLVFVCDNVLFPTMCFFPTIQ